RCNVRGSKIAVVTRHVLQPSSAAQHRKLALERSDELGRATLRFIETNSCFKCCNLSLLIFAHQRTNRVCHCGHQRIRCGALGPERWSQGSLYHYSSPRSCSLEMDDTELFQWLPRAELKEELVRLAVLHHPWRMDDCRTRGVRKVS